MRLTKVELRIYFKEQENVRMIEVLDDREGPKNGLSQCKLVKSLLSLFSNMDGTATLVTKRSEARNSSACQISLKRGYRVVQREFFGDSGMHLVLAKLDLKLESDNFSLENLMEHCQAYFLLRHRIDFKLILIDETAQKVQFPIKFPKTSNPLAKLN